jgi:hypothetical protein
MAVARTMLAGHVRVINIVSPVANETGAGCGSRIGMVPKVPHSEKKDLIRSELLKCATSTPMQFPTFRAFAARVGMPIQGPWRPILDVISAEETNQGLPDITFLLLHRHTRYPMQVGAVRGNDPTPEQRKRARREVQKIIEKYNPGASNPF